MNYESLQSMSYKKLQNIDLEEARQNITLNSKLGGVLKDKSGRSLKITVQKKV